MKALLKTILPLPLLNALRDWQGQIMLNGIERQPMDPSRLRSAANLHVNSIFADPSIEQSWQADHETLSAAIGAKNLMGGVNPGDRKAIYFLIAGLQPKKILEVGTHIAASSFYIAAASARNSGHLTTVDIADVNNAPDAPWREAGYQMSPADYAEKLNFDDRIQFVQSPAVDYMLKTNDRFDFIFLDGDHAPDAVYREVSAALNILAPGGVILLHDYYPYAKPLWQDGNIISGPFRALKRITNENNALKVMPLGDLPWPTKQGSNKTSLALVLRAK